MKLLLILLVSYSVSPQDFVEDKHADLGSSCSGDNGQDRECVSIDKCPEAQELDKKGEGPQICGFEKTASLVCCAKNATSINSEEYGAIAKLKCEEIKLLHVPRFISYVIGGTSASTGNYLHMAALGFGTKDDIKWYCGGSLISSRFILTAAHCTRSKEHGLINWARLGTVDIGKFDPEQGQQDFSIVRRIHHPDYKPPKTYNDIALVELDRDVNFTRFVKPACLHDGVKPEVVDGYFATGWGLIDTEGKRTDWLQEVYLQLFDKEECQKSYGTSRRLTLGISDKQLCAGSRDSIKDTCNGDSGGPLQFKNFLQPERLYRGYTVFGVTSFGKYCGLTNIPGVYSSVYSYLPWIEENVWPQSGIVETTDGINCTWHDGSEGDCISILECPEVHSKTYSPIICGPQTQSIHICCKKKENARSIAQEPNKNLSVAGAEVKVANKTELVKRQSDKLSADCKQADGSDGECVVISWCREMQEMLNEGKPIEPCESDSGLITVCCKKKQGETISKSVARPPTYGLKAKQKCEEIQNLYEPKRYRFVIGGINAQTQDYTHMAALGYGSYDSIKWYCGGSLISKKFILTAAHCLRSREHGLVNWVRLGTTKIGKVDPEQDKQDFLVINRIHNPGYRPPNSYNDIGLLEIDREVVYTNFVRPACVFSGDQPPAGNYFATGWGLLDAHGEQSDWLQEVSLDLFQVSECKKAYGINKRRYADGIIDSQICAGSQLERKDTCSGDSGGPLQFANLHQKGSYRGYTVFGVTSFGRLCGLASVPGVYTKVSQYIPWIEEHVWPQQT